MHLIVTALGSYGDVLPMAGLAAAMQGRGHRVQVVANPFFSGIFESVGVELLPLGTEEHYHWLTHHPDLWKPLRGPRFVLKTGWSDWLRPLYDVLAPHIEPGRTLLAAHPLDVASRVLQDEGKAAAASVLLAPVSMRSMRAAPRMFGALFTERSPRFLQRLQYWVGDVLLVDPLVCPELNRFRREKGLPPVRRILKEWYLSPELAVGLFPEWFAPVQPDWPPQFVPAGFPLWDRIGADVMPPEAERFLAEDDAPIVFAPGSAMRRGERFFAAAAEACHRLKRRGVFLTDYPEQLPVDLPPGVAHFEYVPLSLLLPRSAALVHHGGIGTSSQGLSAGVPQLVSPMAFDQLDNGTRLKRLGVGGVLRRNRLTAGRLTQHLARLLGDPAVAAACKSASEKSAETDGLALACEALEQLAERRGLAQ